MRWTSLDRQTLLGSPESCDPFVHVPAQHALGEIPLLSRVKFHGPFSSSFSCLHSHLPCPSPFLILSESAPSVKADATSPDLPWAAERNWDKHQTTLMWLTGMALKVVLVLLGHPDARPMSSTHVSSAHACPHFVRCLHFLSRLHLGYLLSYPPFLLMRFPRP